MSTAPTSQPTAAATIHEAGLISGASGGVWYGTQIDFAAAVARRVAGQDVVVRGTAIDANRRLAGLIEAAVGPCKRGDPHRNAGPQALPHFQPDPRPPEGHTFYETPRRKARKKP